ncbi:ImmA/IrrE family metallo-endopeptidase [Fusobacterium necrophorum]|uniref:ImmA/IrrE family metallo-endopeptidase n=1 Tax=Fusobacterium necrophorum TaxID=859 RepID=UPI00254CA4F5|nr:ImmA/IrrE family metallo-endopeptidase [Fusobacterium necrophorum]MDK4497941.1 ImmA/IrrE family metallo-endopeptidase [Fusobacterium necrophorum]
MSVDYGELYARISSFLENPAVRVANGDIFKLLDLLKEDLSIKLHPYNDFQDEFMKISNDGYTIYDGKNFHIFYNNMMGKRIRFTLGHELGHIVLGHFLIKDKHLSQEFLDDLEKEANIFSRNVNIPAVKVETYRMLYGDEALKYFFERRGFSREFINCSFAWSSVDYKNIKYNGLNFSRDIIDKELQELNLIFLDINAIAL